MPGFREGVGSLLFGFAFLLRRPKALPLAAVPVFVVLALSSLSVFASLRWALPQFREALPELESELGRTAASVVSWVGAAVVASAGVLFAFVLSPSLSAPALEGLVTLVERERGAPERPSLGFLREVWLGLRAALIGFLVFSPVLLSLWLLELFLPVAIVVTLPLRILVASLSLAYALFDYPQSLRGYPVRARFRLIRAAALPVLGFGVGCSVLFWLPCATPLLLPVGVVGATELFWRILSARPHLAA